MHATTKSLRFAAAVGAVSALLAWSGQASAADDDFFDLDLREVMNLEITTASKKPQTVSRAAAAVFVLTADDIRHSTARTLPDLLRTVPGLQVASISSSVWAVSARGLNGRFANKLLVLIDGRSVYTPTFSGVYWDVQDTLLEDIDRIEVVRGPGGTLWGSNAVNGVINIITKSAASTQGTSVQVGGGSDERAFVGARYGGTLGDSGHFRVYAKSFDRNASDLSLTGTTAFDEWHQVRAGARADLNPRERDSLTIQGDAYSGKAGEPVIAGFLAPPFHVISPTQTETQGANVLLRWQHEVSSADSFTLQSYVDYTRRDWPAHTLERRTTFDFDFQYHTQRLSSQDIVMGLGYRDSDVAYSASFAGIPAMTLPYLQITNRDNGQRLINLFAQDDITLLPRTLILTVGAKLEHHEDTGSELSPNARLLWTPTESSSVWGSVARAVRTPSQIDRDGQPLTAVLEPFGFQNPQAALIPAFTLNPLPLPLLIQSQSTVESEKMTAVELGFKQQLALNLSVDLALFNNEYRNLRSAYFGALTCAPSGLPVPACLFLPPGSSTHVVQSIPVGNFASAKSRGAEVSIEWLPSRTLRVQAAYTLLDTSSTVPANLNEAFTTDRANGAPDNQWSLNATWSPSRNWNLGAVLRGVDRLNPAFDVLVPGYTELDARLSWHPSAAFEVSIAGRNLLHDSHQEYTSELLDVPLMSVQRSIFGQLSLRF